MTTFFFVIVLFFASADGSHYESTTTSVSFDSYEDCVAALGGVRASLPVEQQANFAGAACVEADLGGQLTQAMPD
jgi:hypothetical protein